MKKGFFMFSFMLWAAMLTVSPVESQVVDSTKLYQLNEIVVTALRAQRQTPIAFQDVSGVELRSGNTGQSLPYLLSGTPSLTLTSDGGNGVGYATFRIRGTDASRINFTLDGVPLNDVESHGVFWVNMADFASSLDGIQIQRGVGTSTNGSSAFGATVAMNSSHPHLTPYAEVTSSAGSFGTFTNTIKGGTGLLNDRFIFDARYSNVQTDGYIARARVDMSSYYAAASYYAPATLLKFQTFGSSEVSYQAWNGVDSLKLLTDRRYNSCGAYETADGTTYFYDNQTDNYWQHHYHLLGSHRLSDRLNLHLTLHYTDGRGYYEEYKPDAKYASYKLPQYVDAAGETHKTTDLVRRKWLRNDFYGALVRLNYTSDRLNATFGGAANNYIGDHFGRVIWAKAANTLPDPDYEYYRNRGEKTDYNAYAKAAYHLSPHWNAYADLQYRAIDYTIIGSDDKAGDNVNISRTFSFFNPKAGVSYTRDAHTAYISFAVGHREPARDNFTENGPTAQPRHESLYDWELGYHWTKNRFHLGANLYYMDYDNQLVLTGKISEIGEPLTSNIKSSYRTGIEVTGGVQLLPALDWEVNATLSRNRIRNFTEYVDTYDADWNDLPQTENRLGTTHLAFSPELIANSQLTFHHGGFTTVFASSYVGEQYLDNTSSRRRSIDPYFVNNLRLSYAFHPRFIKEVSLDVMVNNLFNEQYETSGWVWSYLLGGERLQESGYFTQAGTNLMTRITLKF